MARDFQRSRVYAAEEEVPFGKDFDSVEEMQSYVNRILRSTFWKGRSKVREGDIEVFEAGWIWAETYHDTRRKKRIRMPLRCWKEMVIVHELGHIQIGPFYDDSSISIHGPEFVEGYLALVCRFVGKRMEARLRNAYLRHKVEGA